MSTKNKQFPSKSNDTKLTSSNQNGNLIAQIKSIYVFWTTHRPLAYTAKQKGIFFKLLSPNI